MIDRGPGDPTWIVTLDRDDSRGVADSDLGIAVLRAAAAALGVEAS